MSSGFNLNSIYVVFASLFICGTAGAGVGVSLQQRFTIPGLNGPIESIELNDIDTDGNVDALACDGETLTLYCPNDEVTLFSTAISRASISYSTVLSDLNGDGVADVATSQYFPPGVLSFENVCLLEVRDGASGYAEVESARFDMETAGLPQAHSAFLITMIQAVDMEGDGLKQLLFTYDRPRAFPVIDYYMSITSGYSCLFSEFPSATAWEHRKMRGRFLPVRTSVGESCWAAAGYSCEFKIPGNKRSSGWVEVLNSDGDSTASVGESIQPQCTGDSVEILSYLEGVATGDIHQDEYDEILATYRRGETCYSDDAVSSNSSETELRLYRLKSADSLELIWTIYGPPSYSTYFLSKANPGYFFAIDGDIVVQYDGSDGSIYQTSPPLGADSLFWAEIPGVNDGCLVAIEDRTVSLYALDLSTSVEIDPYQSAPSAFELGNPYPNPFNPSCIIEYSLPQRAHTLISIYNVLGQRVVTLVDETKPAGNHSVVWNGRDQSGNAVASGVYFYQLEADGFVGSKRMILIK